MHRVSIPTFFGCGIRPQQFVRVYWPPSGQKLLPIYRQPSTETFRCLWMSMRFVTVSADRCFPLPYVANATPSTTDAEYWTLSVLTCYKGHRFFVGGSEYDFMSMTCQTNGWWSPVLTYCQRECLLRAVLGNYTSRQILLCNYGPILYHFRDIHRRIMVCP